MSRIASHAGYKPGSVGIVGMHGNSGAEIGRLCRFDFLPVQATIITAKYTVVLLYPLRMAAAGISASAKGTWQVKLGV
jgi:hypothetical protein